MLQNHGRDRVEHPYADSKLSYTSIKTIKFAQLLRVPRTLHSYDFTHLENVLPGLRGLFIFSTISSVVSSPRPRYPVRSTVCSSWQSNYPERKQTNRKKFPLEGGHFDKLYNVLHDTNIQHDENRMASSSMVISERMVFFRNFKSHG